MLEDIKNKERGQKSSIFPQKLWRMVNDHELDSAIKWNPDGTSFMVFENQLKNMCLGKENKLFYTNQPKSFVRQLHLYGFRKVSKNQFSHQFFQRGQPELLKDIRRSYRQQQRQQQQQNQHTSTSGGDSSSTSDSSINSTHNNQLICQSLPLPLPSSSSSSLVTAAIAAPVQVANANEIGESALAFANNYDASCGPPITWYETNYNDINFNYNDDTMLTLYNNDIYPDTCNNITL